MTVDSSSLPWHIVTHNHTCSCCLQTLRVRRAHQATTSKLKVNSCAAAQASMQPVPSAIQHRLTRFCKPCSPGDTGHYQYPSHFQQAKASRSRKYGEANVLYNFPSSNISPPSSRLDSIRRTTRLHGKQSFELAAVEGCRTKVRRGLECDTGLSHSAASAVILQNKEAHLDSCLRKRPRHPRLRSPWSVRRKGNYYI